MKENSLEKYDSSNITACWRGSKKSLRSAKRSPPSNKPKQPYMATLEQQVDSNNHIEQIIGNKLLFDYKNKFGITNEDIKPNLLTIPIERASAKDYKKLFEAQITENQLKSEHKQVSQDK